MKHLKILLGLFAIVIAVALMLYPVKKPVWHYETLDSKHAQRFVTVTANRGSPFVAFFDELDRGGLLYFMAKPKSQSLIDTLFPKNPPDEKIVWDQGSIDTAKYSGMFPSTTTDSKGNPHVAYQDGTLGRERLIYATYKNGQWQKEVVAEANPDGINVGAYASITTVNDQPVIFYHTEQGRKYGYAKKVSSRGSTSAEVEPQWQKKTLETGRGWLISTAACKGKIYAADRGRSTPEVFLGTLSNDLWNSRKLEASASMNPALTLDSNCHPFVAYFEPKSESVKIIDIDNNLTHTLAQGYYSSVSLASTKDELFALYHVEQKGLYLASSKDKGATWNATLLAPGKYTGNYNSLYADSSSNLYLAFIDGKAVKFGQYLTSTYNLWQTLKKASPVVLTAGLLLMFLVFYQPKKAVKSKKSVKRMQKHVN